MADILKHPDFSKNSNQLVITSGSGAVIITAPQGETLSVERANFLLDDAKFRLMQGLQESEEK